jgi:hypothetical protein
MFRTTLTTYLVAAFVLTAIPAHASSNACAAGKEQCVSKKTAAILKCYGKADNPGLAPGALGTCIQKAQDTFDGAADPAKGCFAKLEARFPGTCLTTSDAAALEAAVDAFTTDTFCALHPLDASGACWKLVFITSTTYATGNLNGLAGADAICQALAGAAALPGTFKAWLSTATISAASRLTHSTRPYKLVDGTPVANNWTDLTDGSLSVSIHETESGASVSSRFIWTNTAIDGSGLTYDCLGWTSSSSSALGDVGGSGDTTAFWTNRAPYYCDGSLFGTTPRALYCFQQ